MPVEKKGSKGSSPKVHQYFKVEGDKVIKFWSDRNLPKSNISLDANNVKLSAESLSKIKLDPKFLTKIKQLGEKSSKIYKKRLY